MKIFNMKRGSGKTTLLIILSHFTKARIITSNASSATYIKYMAQDMNLSIPNPMSCYDYRGYAREEKILIDELDNVLFNIFRSPVLAATRTGD